MNKKILFNKNSVKQSIMILILLIIPVISLIIIFSITPPVKEISYAYLVDLIKRQQVSHVNIVHNRLDIYLTEEGEKAEALRPGNVNKHHFKDYVVNNVNLTEEQLKFLKKNGLKIEKSEMNLLPFAGFMLIMIFLIGLAKWKQRKYMLALQQAHPELNFETITPEENKQSLKETLQYLKEHHKKRYYIVIICTFLPFLVLLFMVLFVIIGTVSVMFKLI